MVLQYVGFVGAWQHPGALGPLAAATLGAAITTWVTFVPCFIYIFLGAPYVERLRNVPALHAALTAITAAVVGVVLNLAVWFGWHVIKPDTGGTNWFALALATVFFTGLWRWKWNTMLVVAAGAALGLARHFFS
jgi:chromate transporter